MEIKTFTKTRVEFKVTLELSENEARAWDAIVGYGWEAFEKVFKEHLGKHYIQPYSNEAKEMFEHTRKNIGFQLHAVDEVKKAIAKINNKDSIEVV